MRARAYRNGVVLSPTVPFGSGDSAGRRLPTSPAIEGDRISRSLTARARPSPRGFSRWRRSGRLSLARGAFGVSARAGLDDDSGSSSRRTSILARAATMAAREACMTRAP